MATEIAEAYVAIYAKMPGIKKEIEKELGGAVDGAAGQKAGKSIGDHILAGAGNVLKAGAVGLGAFAAAGLGTALVKGFQRLDALDQARAKLSGLGHDAQGVETIMNDALASVKGTAFGMGDAATVAASVVAAGVKPGEDLQRTLTLVGDAATIAGTDMSTMGSIINKVATSDMMQMDVANQLMDAGIPILQMVGDEMGVTAEEARKLASEGKISFETFQSALESGLGGAALESGNTFSGAMDNVMAALGRVGESLLSGVFEGAKDGFGDLTTVLDDMQPTFEEIGTAVGEFAQDAIPALIDGIKDAVNWLKDAGQWVQDNSTWLGPLAAAVGGAALAYGAWTTAISIWQGVTKAAAAVQVAFNAVMNANPIMLIVTAIAALVAGLVYFFTQTELGQQIWETVMDAIGAAFTWLWESVIQPIGQFFQDAFTAIGDAATWLYENAIKPAFDAIGAIFQWIYDTFIHPQVVAIQIILEALGAVFEWLYENAVKPAFDAIGDIFEWICNNIILPNIVAAQIIIEALGAVFTWLWENAVQPAINSIGDIFNWLYDNVIKPVWESIKSAISTAWDNISKVFTSVDNAIRGTLAKVFNWLYDNVISPVWDNIKSAIQVVGDWFQNTIVPAFESATGFVGDAFNTMKDVVAKAWEAIKAAAVAPVNFVINTVYNDGIKAMFDKLAETVGIETRMPYVEPIKLASGGVLPGYTPGRDVHQFYSPTAGWLHLSGGEGIIRPDALQALGGKPWLDAVNNARSRAGQTHFADGGIWENIGNGFAGAMEWLGGVGDAFGQVLSDPLGAIKKLILEPVRGLLNNIGGGILGDIIAGVPLKIVDWIGDFFTDRTKNVKIDAQGYHGGATLQRLLPIIAKYGLTITDTYGTPEHNRRLGRSPTSYHGDYENPAVDLWHASFAQMERAANEIIGMGGWRQILWKVAGHWDHIHVANQGGVFGDLPYRKYDSGGYLQPGLTLVDNQTGKPEPVLTSEQWDAMQEGRGVTINQTNYMPVADPNVIGDRLAAAAARGLIGVTG